DRLDLLVGVGSGEVEEYGRDALQEIAGTLQGIDGVGEGRRLVVAGDSANLAPVDGKALVEGRHEMLDLDAIERRHLERRRPGLEQRILRLRGRLGSRTRHRRLGTAGARSLPLLARLACHDDLLPRRLGASYDRSWRLCRGASAVTDPPGVAPPRVDSVPYI